MAADLSLIEKSATDIVKLLKAGEVTPIDLLDTLEKRIKPPWTARSMPCRRSASTGPASTPAR
jgi:hypothetical protein